MLELTDLAATKLGELHNNLPEPKPSLRVFMDHRCHCGAAHFSMALDGTPQPSDLAFEVKDVPFLADPEMAKELDSVEIDYIENLMTQGFTISNREHQCGGQM